MAPLHKLQFDYKNSDILFLLLPLRIRHRRDSSRYFFISVLSFSLIFVCVFFFSSSIVPSYRQKHTLFVTELCLFLLFFFRMEMSPNVDAIGRKCMYFGCNAHNSLRRCLCRHSHFNSPAKYPHTSENRCHRLSSH